MNQRIGTFITKQALGEPFKAYIPPSLPPKPPINLAKLYPYLEKATLALAELNSMAKSIPNISLFIYMYVRKEALLSSQIEGTQSSFADLILFEHHGKMYRPFIAPNGLQNGLPNGLPNGLQNVTTYQERRSKQSTVSLEDVEEVSNYVKAISHGLNRLKEGFPLSLRLLREIHGILLSGGRGSGKLPGEFRHSQNWIGGTRPGNALFVPPPVECMEACLSDFELFLHDRSLPMLIKAGLAHVQFETIHPFLDGNGRLGRLLITLLLCESGMLDEPLLYLSLYLKQHRADYYELLQQVRFYGTWEAWLEFFLEGVFNTAKQALSTAGKINKLFEYDLAKIERLGRARFSCKQVLEYVKQLPQVTVQHISQALDMTAPTARSALNQMVELNILEEISGQKRDKVYIYNNYLLMLEEGAEPL
jgi:Fic family protein